MSSFGDELGRLLKSREMTQKQLADRIGVYQSFISKLMSGEQSRLSAFLLFRMCDELGIPADYFKPFLYADEAAKAAAE